MNGNSKFFILGFLFFLTVSIFKLFVYTNYYLSNLDFVAGFAAAVTIAVGILKNQKVGVSFGFSSFVAYSLMDFIHYGAPFLLIVSFNFPIGVAMALYGYLPTRFYLPSRQVGRALTGFLISLFLNLILSSLALLALTGGLYFWQLETTTITLVLGAISVMVCARYTKLHAKPTSSLPVHTAPLIPNLNQIRCAKCGHENPPEFEFCGRCGSRLKEDATQIY